MKNRSAARFLTTRIRAIRHELSTTEADPRPVARTMAASLRRDLRALELRLQEAR